MSTREVSALLVEVSRQSWSTTRLPLESYPDLVEAARFHRIAPLLHVAHRERVPGVAELFVSDRRRAIAGHLQACGALWQLGETLGDLQWVTFKGPLLSEHAHPVPGLRSYNDVDVLVAPARLREVAHRLHAAGWQVADYDDMLRNRAVPGEMHWITPGGVLVDLHWSMINMESRRRLFDVSTDELLGRRIRTTLGTRPVWGLDPTDALVHTCLHAALSGAHKLLYLIDVDRLSRSVLDWGLVAERAKQWHAQAQVVLALTRARHVLDTPLPADLAGCLEVPRSLTMLMALTDRVAPVAQVRDNSGLAKFVARAVRPGGRATAAAIGRNSALWLADRLRRTPDPERARGRADAAALEVYLTAVERAATLS